MDFKTKLAFALVAASLSSMAALGYFTYLWAADTFLEDSQRQLSVLADSKQNEIDGVVAGWKQEVRTLAARAQASLPTAGGLEGIEATSMEQVIGLLRDAAASSESVRRVAIFDVGGKVLFVSDGAELEAIATAPEDGVTYAGIRVEPEQSFGLAFQATLSLDEERPGFLEVVFDARSLEGLFGRMTEIGQTGEASLVISGHRGGSEPGSSDGAYLLVSSSKDTGELDRSLRALAEAPAATSAALGGEERVFEQVSDLHGDEVMAVTRFLPEIGAGIVIEVDRAEAQQRSSRLFGNMRDIGISLAAFAILGGTLFGLYLARPIHKLVEEVDRIRHGELGLRLDVKGEDEVAFLAQSLNEFMDQLDRSSDLFRLGDLEVLVVDRDARNRELYEGLLQNWQMRPTLAGSGDAALSALEEARKAGRPLQLVLLDESVREHDGEAFAEQLLGTSPEPMPIILLSAEVDGSEGNLLKPAGIGRVLPKPVVASHLMEAIIDEMGVSAQSLASTTDVYLKRTATRRILLAEDNPIIQRVMLGLLKNWGHEVTLAENGQIAVEAVGRERFDLILMDVEMPEMNGLDATQAIRASESAGGVRTPIVALTAEAMSGDRERCLAAGMDDYMVKPVDARALYALVERCPAHSLA